MLFSPLLKGGHAPPTHRQERQVPAWSSGAGMRAWEVCKHPYFVGHTCLEVAPTETGFQGLGPEESK